jgi:hypothetical protein
MASYFYLDWAITALQKAARDLSGLLDRAGSMSDNCLEAARISSDLVTLTSFTHQILQDLVPTLVNTAAGCCQGPGYPSAFGC